VTEALALSGGVCTLGAGTVYAKAAAEIEKLKE